MKFIYLLIVFLTIQNCYSTQFPINLKNDTLPRGTYSYDLLKINFANLDLTYMSLWDSGIQFEQHFLTEEDKAEKISKEWNLLLQSMADFFVKNNYIWQSPTSFFVKFYFDKNGGIDYLFYNPKNNEFNPNLQFVSILNKFIKNYRFDLKAKSKYSQCGGVVFKPKEK